MDRKRQAGFGLMNPMTMAGLSILSSGDVGKGMQMLQQSRQHRGLMDFRQEQAEQARAIQQQRLAANQEMANRSFGLQQKQFEAGRPLNAARLKLLQAQAAKLNRGPTKGDPRYGLNPIPVQNPDGSIGYVVPNTAGGAKALQLPNGAKAITPASTYQMPTETVTRDKYGNIIRREKKDVAGAAREGALGKDQGTARIKLPMVENETRRIIGYIDGVINHPSFQASTGALSAYRPSFTASARDFNARSAQLKGKAFVTAFERLKGAGAVTQIEGENAANALARLQDAAVGSENYKKALEDFKREVVGLRNIIRQRAGVAPAISPQDDSSGWTIRKVDE